MADRVDDPDVTKEFVTFTLAAGLTPVEKTRWDEFLRRVRVQGRGATTDAQVMMRLVEWGQIGAAKDSRG